MISKETLIMMKIEKFKMIFKQSSKYENFNLNKTESSYVLNALTANREMNKLNAHIISRLKRRPDSV